MDVGAGCFLVGAGVGIVRESKEQMLGSGSVVDWCLVTVVEFSRVMIETPPPSFTSTARNDSRAYLANRFLGWPPSRSELKCDE